MLIVAGNLKTLYDFNIVNVERKKKLLIKYFSNSMKIPFSSKRSFCSSRHFLIFSGSSLNSFLLNIEVGEGVTKSNSQVLN